MFYENKDEGGGQKCVGGGGGDREKCAAFYRTHKQKVTQTEMGDMRSPTEEAGQSL